MAGTFRIRMTSTFGPPGDLAQGLLELLGRAEEEGSVDLVDLHARRDLPPVDGAPVVATDRAGLRRTPAGPR